jgi:hypothetical protein
MLKAFLQTLFAWQRGRGRARGLLHGQTGSVSVTQRMGGALNAHTHIHAVLPDGLFLPTPGGRLAFAPLPPPTTEEVEELTATIARRCGERLLRAHEHQGDGLALHPELAALYQALFLALHAPQARPGATLNIWEDSSEDPQLSPGSPCAHLAGFPLHAAPSVPAHDREALEGLLRYALRPPFAGGRLSLSSGGQVLYQLRRPWPRPGGATQLVLDPLEFLRRLAALLPRPYAHAARYHGCFASRSAARRLLPSPPARPEQILPSATAVEPLEADNTAGTEPCLHPSHRGHRHPWHQLLRRVLHVEGLSCPRCSRPGVPAAMVVLAFLSDPPVVEKILRHLKLPANAPAIAPARSTSAGLFPRLAPNPLENAAGFPLPDSCSLRDPGDDEATGGEEEESRPHARIPPDTASGGQVCMAVICDVRYPRVGPGSCVRPCPHGGNRLRESRQAVPALRKPGRRPAPKARFPSTADPDSIRPGARTSQMQLRGTRPLREGTMEPTEIILYVADQAASGRFYRAVLGLAPTLEVPGMTEFPLPGGAVLGLMPEAGIRRLLGPSLPDPSVGRGIPRAELYLLVSDPEAWHHRALTAGARAR